MTNDKLEPPGASQTPTDKQALPSQTVTPLKSILADLPSLSRPVEVDSADVVRLIEQFLLENNLTSTLMALQKESGVTLNCVADLQKFLTDIAHGNWERVLSQVAYLSLPPAKLIELLEQICLELAEGGEHHAALLLIERSSVTEQWASQHSERYQRLIRLLRRNASGASEIYPPGITRERRRLLVVQNLRKEVHEAPPSRLLELITQALRFRSLRGALPEAVISGPTSTSTQGEGSSARTLELFFSDAADVPEETVPARLGKTLQMGEGATAESLCFSPEGQYLVSGSSDGFIEAWDAERGQLSLELSYQAKGQFLMHESGDAVVCLAFAPDGELLASATAKGEVKVWKFFSGELCRTLRLDSRASACALAFSADGSKLLVGSGDGNVRLFGLRSGALVKTIHVNIVSGVPVGGMVKNVGSIVHVAFSLDENETWISTSSGVFGLWNLRTGQCSSKTTLPNFQDSSSLGSSEKRDGLGDFETHISSCMELPGRPDVFLIATQTSTTVLYSPSSNTILQRYTAQVNSSASGAKSDEGSSLVEITLCTSSQRGRYIYGAATDGIIYVFNAETGAVLKAFRAHPRAVTGIVNHPFKSLLATTSADGKIKIWK